MFYLFSGEYGNDASCDWTITVPEGYTPYFEADVVDIRGFATKDILKIFDGPSVKSQMIESIAENQENLPKVVLGTGNVMHITFSSGGQLEKGWMDTYKWDVPITGKGFSAIITAKKSTANQKLVLDAVGKSLTLETFNYPGMSPL